MGAYAALLRAVNVGGTGKLPMVELRRLCEECGLRDVATYIQSGNVAFRSPKTEAQVKKALGSALAAWMGKPVGVLVRTDRELASALRANPFPEVAPNRLQVVFLDEAPPKASIAKVDVPGGEELRLVGRELYIHFPDGMGKSKLKIPFRDVGTARNLNTVRKLAEMTATLAAAKS